MVDLSPVHYEVGVNPSVILLDDYSFQDIGCAKWNTIGITVIDEGHKLRKLRQWALGLELVGVDRMNSGPVPLRKSVAPRDC